MVKLEVRSRSFGRVRQSGEKVLGPDLIALKSSADGWVLESTWARSKSLTALSVIVLMTWCLQGWRHHHRAWSEVDYYIDSPSLPLRCESSLDPNLSSHLLASGKVRTVGDGWPRYDDFSLPRIRSPQHPQIKPTSIHILLPHNLTI